MVEHEGALLLIELVGHDKSGLSFATIIAGGIYL